MQERTQRQAAEEEEGPTVEAETDGRQELEEVVGVELYRGW